MFVFVFLNFQKVPVAPTKSPTDYARSTANDKSMTLGLAFHKPKVFSKEVSVEAVYFLQHFRGSLKLQLLIQFTIYILQMEKEKKQTSTINQRIKIHACFQQAETLRLLPFIEHEQGRIVYKGLTEEQNRKSKEFLFDSITCLTDKLKHAYTKQIREVIDALLKGESRSILIFGNQQSKKEKLMIGQSQNAGLLLLTLSELFNVCYDRQLEDKVTIKLSCWQKSETQFCDGFGLNTSMLISQDEFQSKVFVGNPEIIVRNMKSALKIIKLFMKKTEQLRQLKEDTTQTLAITIKLQIDSSYDKQGNPIQFKLSKLHVIKFANPSCYKSFGKHSQWFISLFNSFQADALEKIRGQQTQIEDQIIGYIKQCIIRQSHAIDCFTVFNNKMTPNECLNYLKFSSYLQCAKLNPQNMVINLLQIKKDHLIYESQLLKTEDQKKLWTKSKQLQWFEQEQHETIEQFQSILSLNLKGMELGNILEYQYALNLTVCCDKLEKYIFNEEVQDYFYAKKVNIQMTNQLKHSLNNFFEAKTKSIELQKKVVHRINGMISKLKREFMDSRAGKYLINAKIKQKTICQKLFLLYNSMVAHFLYEENEGISDKITSYKSSLKQVITVQAEKNPLIELSNISTQLLEKARLNEAQPQPVPTQKPEQKRKKIIDELEMMFTNTNANLCTRKLKN